MLNSEVRSSFSESNKYIEDVIDERKKCGEYDICSQSDNNINYRTSNGTNEEKFVRFDDNVQWADSDVPNYNAPSIGPTDSEITIVRVKRKGLQFKRIANCWDLHDEAIPGDGTHLGESPSMVNLVTLVGQSIQSLHSLPYETNEYLVPLSSWDPVDKPPEFADVRCTMEANYRTIQPLLQECNVDEDREQNAEEEKELHVLKSPCDMRRRSSLAGRITNFLRKHCSIKTKSSENDVICSKKN